MTEITRMLTTFQSVTRSAQMEREMEGQLKRHMEEDNHRNRWGSMAKIWRKNKMGRQMKWQCRLGKRKRERCSAAECGTILLHSNLCESNDNVSYFNRLQTKLFFSWLVLLFFFLWSQLDKVWFLVDLCCRKLFSYLYGVEFCISSLFSVCACALRLRSPCGLTSDGWHLSGPLRV